MGSAWGKSKWGGCSPWVSYGSGGKKVLTMGTETGTLPGDSKTCLKTPRHPLIDIMPLGTALGDTYLIKTRNPRIYPCLIKRCLVA